MYTRLNNKIGKKMTESHPAHIPTDPSDKDTPKGVTPGFIDALQDPNYQDPDIVDWHQSAKPASDAVEARHRASVTGITVEINPGLLNKRKHS
jgi:hypothetical protein